MITFDKMGVTMYKATEFESDTLEVTGKIEYYQADSLEDAVKQCLYTHKLSDRGAKVGPTGRAVYANNKLYAVTSV